MLSDIFRRKNIDQIHSELAAEQALGGNGLGKNLTLFDLVCFGIAAIIGAGIFSTIGNAAADGGPAVSLLFILTAIACLFSALCYAEFASTIPISGSAYTYLHGIWRDHCLDHRLEPFDGVCDWQQHDCLQLVAIFFQHCRRTALEQPTSILDTRLVRDRLL